VGGCGSQPWQSAVAVAISGGNGSGRQLSSGWAAPPGAASGQTLIVLMVHMPAAMMVNIPAAVPVGY
jgi:hypothetical protein